jgi:hypothetical protein
MLRRVCAVQVGHGSLDLSQMPRDVHTVYLKDIAQVQLQRKPRHNRWPQPNPIPVESSRFV